MFKETGGFSKKGNLRSNKVYLYIYSYSPYIYIYNYMIESITVSSESSHKPFLGGSNMGACTSTLIWSQTTWFYSDFGSTHKTNEPTSFPSNQVHQILEKTCQLGSNVHLCARDKSTFGTVHQCTSVGILGWGDLGFVFPHSPVGSRIVSQVGNPITPCSYRPRCDYVFHIHLPKFQRVFG